jgi:hypothetical protein
VLREPEFITCYHGTSKENADKILNKGFKPDSWFARHIEDALGMGGSTILCVKFENKFIPKGFQFHVLNAIPKESVQKVIAIQEVIHAEQ